MNDQMRDAVTRQIEQQFKAQRVCRTGWTRQQWVDDARTLMDHIDGAVTSLVNGHVLALLDEAAALDRVRALCESNAGVATRDGALMVSTIRAAMKESK